MRGAPSTGAEAVSWRRAEQRRQAERLRLAGATAAPRVPLTPRKLPRQARARATFDAIVDACAQVLAAGSYEGLTTNSISERAGVSIGTLYEYFPNRESIVATLAAQSCQRLVSAMRTAARQAAGMSPFEGVEHLLAAGIDTLACERNVFKALLREAPFVTTLPAMQEARAALDALCQAIRVEAADMLDLPSPEADTWLISQMLFNAMLEIAFVDDEARRLHLRGELVRLTCRMALGRDVAPAQR